MTSALREQGKAAIRAREVERARSIYEELVVLAEEVGDPWNGAVALNNLGDLALYAGEWERTIELCGRSSEVRFGLGDRWGGALALSNVATAQIRFGDLDAGARSLAKAFEESLAVDARMVVHGCLGNAVILAGAKDDPRTAAILLGALQRASNELDVRVEGFEEDLMQEIGAAARTQLGDDEFERALAYGGELELNDAAGFALASTGG
jgi:hypothetical protein